MLKKILLGLFLIILVNLSFAYNIESQDTEITFTKFDVYKISEKLEIKNNTSKTLEFFIVPSYDVIIKINNQKYFNYSYSTDKLTIDLDNILENFNLEITYLTDYYTNKNLGIWNLKYYSTHTENINNLKLTLPKNVELKNTFEYDTLQILNKQIIVFFKDIKQIDVEYDIKEVKNYNYLYFLLLPLILIGFFLLFVKSKKINKKQIKTDLLLGLNENEQKIMKVLMENEGQSQKIITAKTYLPKGTVSRNIKKLMSKGYIEIKKYGVSNKLFLGEVFTKNKK